MKFTAIICEHNPLSLGHIKILTEAKKLGNPIICIMSGNFVQRGEPAILDKYARTKHTIQAGADIVIELPTIFALSSAPDFAFGAVNILNSLNNVEYLLFGSECGNINELTNVAENLLIEDNNTKTKIKENLKEGKSFASSVINEYPILQKPNNLLAVEYIKSIKKLNSNIKPITIKREDNYNSSDGAMPSSSAIRKFLNENRNNLSNELFKSVNICPEFVYNDVLQNGFTDISKLNNLISFEIRKTTTESLKSINGTKEGLENKIIKEFNTNQQYDEILNNITSKRYPLSLIKRICCNNLLNVTKGIVNIAKNTKPYVKVLGIKKECLNLLSCLTNETATLLTQKSDYLNLSKEQQKIIKPDLDASIVYSTINTNYHPESDYKIGMIKI